MSTLAPSVRGKSWVFQVTALCIVLGMLLALSLKTHTEARRVGIPTRPIVEDAARLVAKENVKLKKDLAHINQRYEKLAKAQAYGVRTSDFQRLFDETKRFAGTAAVRGPGIAVVLHDSPKHNTSGMSDDVLSQYIVHDRDIREVVNELFAAGAEAISVNGQRLISNSSVRCVGPVVRVNSTPIAPPFVIKAIGKAETLQNALNLPGGPAEGLFLLDMIEVTREPDIEIPAYAGSTRFNYAR